MKVPETPVEKEVLDEGGAESDALDAFPALDDPEFSRPADIWPTLSAEVKDAVLRHIDTK